MFSTWLAVVIICLLGAMTPGPSLALVLKHTLASGKRAGILTGIGHGLGIGLYGLATVLGLAVVITNFLWVFAAIQLFGAVFLLYLAWQGLTSQPKQDNINSQAIFNLTPVADKSEDNKGLRDGFLMACLNPYAALFFLALFSQLISADTPLIAKLIFALTAMLIDMAWYSSVAWLFTRPLWLSKLQAASYWLEKVLAVIFIALAIKLIFSIFSGLAG